MAKDKILNVPEEELAALGLNVEKLKSDQDIWKALQSGGKTPLLDMKGTCNGKPIYFAAKLHLWEDSTTGVVHPYVHTVKSNISLRPYREIAPEFTPQEIAMLHSKEGMITHPIVLNFNGKEVPCLVGVDKDVNEIVHIPTYNIYVPEKLMGTEVTKEQQDTIRNGGSVFFPELKRKDGTVFPSVISFSFQRNNGNGGLIFKEPSPRLLQETRIASGKSEGKVEKTKQSEDITQKNTPSEKEKKGKRKGGPKI